MHNSENRINKNAYKLTNKKIKINFDPRST